jgi:hypothetical protein
MGYLELIMGPMFSGKTSRLIQIKRKYDILNKSILVIKPIIDNRYSENSVIVTHDKNREECVSRFKLSDVLDIDKYDVVIIEVAGHDHYADLRYHSSNNVLDLPDPAVKFDFHNILISPGVTTWDEQNPGVAYFEIN